VSTPITADAVVIGAGILGAATAFRLAHEGHRVVVLERGAANREGSGSTAGNLHVQAVHVRRPGQRVPLDSRRFLPLQKAASDRWERVADELDADIELTRAGGLTVAETEEQHAELVTKSRWEAESGVPTELLTGEAARAMMPELGPTVRAATWCPIDGYANPLLVTPAYLRAAARHGARIYTGQPVRALRRRAQAWQVTTDTQVAEAPVVVDAAGPWMADVAALASVTLRMTPVAIQMHATVRTPPLLRHLVQHIGEGLSVKQVTAGNVLIGGGWPAAPINLNGRSGVRVASMAGNLAQALRILPVLRGLRLLRMWAGPLAATPDEMPIIGELPGADGLFVAGGTYAFTFAPLWADTLAALVRGSTPPVALDGLTPERLVLDGSVREQAS
jgi:Glycine/D-amino acid oxidases (deaminating)